MLIWHLHIILQCSDDQLSCHLIQNVESCCVSRERMSGQNFREGIGNLKDLRLCEGMVFPSSCASESNAPGAWQNIGIWKKDCDHKWVWECDLLGFIINISAFCTHRLNSHLVVSEDRNTADDCKTLDKLRKLLQHNLTQQFPKLVSKLCPFGRASARMASFLVGDT